MKQNRVQKLLQQLAAEEQDAVARMIERHSQEMLLLIAEKVGGRDQAWGEYWTKVLEYKYKYLKK